MLLPIIESCYLYIGNKILTEYFAEVNLYIGRFYKLFDMILSIPEKGYILMEYGQVIAHRILCLCKARGVSVNKLASMSNLKQSTLDNIINGAPRTQGL